MNDFKKYILFWLGQSVSLLGSSMTGFALILWTYEQEHSAMTVSLMSFCSYVPFILMSLAAGSFVDRHSKKAVMLAADSAAALCSLSVLFLWADGSLRVSHIYIVNAVIGFTNAFQQPAAAAAVGNLVPKGKLSNASGMNSFSESTVSVLCPVLAAAVFSFGGLGAILLIDLLSFVFAFLVLLLGIQIPESRTAACKEPPFAGAAEGFRFLRREKGLLLLMLTMALINFFSRLTYENILSPMILARSGGRTRALGMVNAAMGLGGIAGGVIVSWKKGSGRNAATVYFSAAFSFLCGDILMAVGRNALAWSAAGIAASLPVPFIMAAQNVLLYSRIPPEMQGRVFAVRGGIQYSTIPFGILLGGFLADYVFEPFMRSDTALAHGLSLLVGSGDGSGMAVMFLFTGTAGFLISCLSGRSREIRRLDEG